MATKRKLYTRTYEQKLEIVQYAEKNPGRKKKHIAAHFDISPQTLGDILKNKDKIKEACSSEDRTLSTSKRQKTITHPKVDEALLMWVRQMTSGKGEKVSRPIPRGVR